MMRSIWALVPTAMILLGALCCASPPPDNAWPTEPPTGWFDGLVTCSIAPVVGWLNGSPQACPSREHGSSARDPCLWPQVPLTGWLEGSPWALYTRPESPGTAADLDTPPSGPGSAWPAPPESTSSEPAPCMRPTSP